MSNLILCDISHNIKQLVKIIIIFICLSSFSFYNNYSYNLYYIRKQNRKNRIAIVLGTRPEAIKMIPIIKQLKKNKNFKCFTINTGQHKKMINQILKSLKMSKSIDIKLNIMKKNQTLGELTSKTISKLSKIYSSIQPDAVVVQGDTTTSFAAALSAFYQKIPVFHVEAGLRTNNLYSPFPEEFNRVGIDDISTLYFAATNIAANNLIKENKNPNRIFITGNTIVDTLKLTLENTSPSKYIKSILNRAMNKCKSKYNCKIILLTCHRRENYFGPIINILKVVQKLLEKFDDIVIILPFHLNPNVIQSIKMGLPNIIYDDIINGKEIVNQNYLYFNRFFLIKPLDYIDLVHLQSLCFFIMTDSGGIQEEGVSIGKPVLILRENTERPEAIQVGSAILAGTSQENIFYFASMLLTNQTLYNKMSSSHDVYGSGNSSIIIVNIIEHFFFGYKLSSSYYNNINIFNIINYDNIISQYDNSVLKYPKEIEYDLVIVLIVLEKDNLIKQLRQIKRQSLLKNKKTNIIILKNSNHVDVDNIIEEWKKPRTFFDFVNITFIKSPIEIGYFGHFIAPLITPVTMEANFIIYKDNSILGDKYFENMIRVVDEGFLATKKGKLLNTNYLEFSPKLQIFGKETQMCFNEDIEYDFGEHIWAGRISWIRKALSHIPNSLENCDDFWLSSTLKTFYNISTRTPKCPCPTKKPIIPELCAASEENALINEESSINKSTINSSERAKIINDIIKYYNYKPLIFSDPYITEKIKNKFLFGNKTFPLFDLSDDRWNNSLFWQ